MTSFSRLRALESLGYVCAVTIGLAMITRQPELRFLQAACIVLVVIVVIRLLVMSVSLSAGRHGRDEPDDAPAPSDEEAAGERRSS